MEFAPAGQIPLDRNGQPVNGAMVRYGDDRSLAVKFYRNAQRDADYVEIAPIGGKTIIQRLAIEPDKIRFPLEWELYIREQTGGTLQIGTPLTEVETFGEELLAQLKVWRIHSVEQLAALNEHAFQAYGMGAKLACKDAQKWLAAREERAKTSIADENAKLRGMVEALMHKLTAMEEKLNDTPKPRARRRRGTEHRGSELPDVGDGPGGSAAPEAGAEVG